MARKKSVPKGGINIDLENAISELLVKVMNDPEASLTDRCKVIDRALNLEKIKQKVDGDSWGEGLFDDDEEEG
jgi:hypothetical protein